MDEFNYDKLRLAIEATENAKKVVDDLVRKAKQQRVRNEELFDKMALMHESIVKLLSKMENNQKGSNNSKLIY